MRPFRFSSFVLSPVASLVLAVIFVISTSGCATLFTGSSDNIIFESDPSGAEIVIDGLVVGRTPTTVSVKRPGLGDKQVTLRLDGYSPVTFTLTKSFNTIAILNLSNVFGWGIDVLTGAVMKYDKQLYNVDMSRGSVSFNLQDLEQETGGSYLLPQVEGGFTITDEGSGLVYVFQ